MSRYLSKKYSGLRPYTPGEQPRDMRYVKLNTNESPFPPSPGVLKAVEAECGRLQLYSDPRSAELTAAIAESFGLEPENVLVTNGSDEILNFAFMAFADEEHPMAFPDISYGFYPVFAGLNRVPYVEIPLRGDFSIDPEDYLGIGRGIVIANPNAPTGLCLPLRDIERIVKSNPDNVVVIDEAYVDFGGESAVGLIKECGNLLVCRTFSKSRSMAGARLGFGLGSRELIEDLNRIKYSTNPYNVNRMSAAAGLAAMKEDSYYRENCLEIVAVREETGAALEALGFRVLPSKANFIFAESEKIAGGALYLALKARGILVRHFDKKRIDNFIRVTIGARAQMEEFLNAVNQILKEQT